MAANRPAAAGGRRAAAGRAAGQRAAAEPPAARWLRLGLATLWLLDAALQFQPSMFGPGLARMLAATAGGNPAAVAVPVTWAAHLTGQHPAVANAVFAAGQAALGLGIAWRPATRIALAASAAWAVAVWWLGEGLGGLLAGTASPAGGAPGAAVIYALLAVLLWPSGPARTAQPGRAALPAARGAGPAAARTAWFLLWGGLACLAVTAAPAAPLAAFRHPPGSLLLAAAFAVIAAGVALPAAGQRGAVLAAAALSLALWAAGQRFGAVLSGTATDPGTGPVLALLALAYWPSRPPGTRPATASGRSPAAGADAAPGTWPQPATAARPARAVTPGQPPEVTPPAPGRAATIMQVLMALGMAGMLLPALSPVPVRAWAVPAAAGTAWFGWRLRRCLACPAGQRARAEQLPHLLACGAMLYMALAAAPAASGPGRMAMAATAGMTTAGMTGAPSGPAAVLGSVAALVLAAALAGCAASLADRLGAAAPAAAGRALLMPRVAACCQVGMGVTMACLLVQMA